MASKHPMFGLRVPVELMEKLKYIAEYNARSANKEIEWLLRTHIEKFEEKHGRIIN